MRVRYAAQLLLLIAIALTSIPSLADVSLPKKIKAHLDDELAKAYRLLEEPGYPSDPAIKWTIVGNEVCRDVIRQFIERKLPVPAQAKMVSVNKAQAIKMHRYLKQQAALYRHAELARHPTTEADARQRKRADGAPALQSETEFRQAVFESTWREKAPGGIGPMATSLLFESFDLPIRHPSLTVIMISNERPPNAEFVREWSWVSWDRINQEGVFVDGAHFLNESWVFSPGGDPLYQRAGIVMYQPNGNGRPLPVVWAAAKQPRMRALPIGGWRYDTIARFNLNGVNGSYFSSDCTLTHEGE